MYIYSPSVVSPHWEPPPQAHEVAPDPLRELVCDVLSDNRNLWTVPEFEK